MSVISAGTTSTTAFKVTSDTTGTLVLQTGAVPTTAISISSSQVVTFPATTTLDFTGTLLLGDGSATAPTLAHSGDTNTGIYFPGADQIAITTGGSQKFFVGTSLVINEGGLDFDTRIEGDTDANLFFADASTDRIGVGTASPSTKLHVVGTVNTEEAISFGASYLGTGTDYYDSRYLTSRIFNVPTGGGFVFAINNSDKLTLDSSGNLGLGVTPSAWDSGYKALQIGQAASFWGATGSNFTTITNNAIFDGAYKYKNNGIATQYVMGTGGTHAWNIAASGTAGNAITFTQAMTLDASGNLSVGGTAVYNSAASRGNITIEGASTSILNFGIGGTLGGYVYHNGTDIDFRNSKNGTIQFATNGTERARITATGAFLFGTTAEFSLLSSTATGGFFDASGAIVSYTSDNPTAYFGRQTNDGTIVAFYQGGTSEGSISVSGNTVSYNAFAGSHWSQLQDGSKPDILRGTVMESINELCVWPDENNERLPKSKISDTAGSKKVYGVFMAWDNDWTETNDMYVTAVGAFICRVNGSVTVQEGDLLESNGDGTARVQADDIIRSSTIGKVTSTVKTHQYDDGSYCVPTVLYCG